MQKFLVLVFYFIIISHVCFCLNSVLLVVLFFSSHHGHYALSKLWENPGWRSSSTDLHFQRSGQCFARCSSHTHLLSHTGRQNTHKGITDNYKVCLTYICHLFMDKYVQILPLLHIFHRASGLALRLPTLVLQYWTVVKK